MTETAPAPVTLPGPAPAEPHESILTRAENRIHGEPPAVKAVSEEMEALLRGHSAALIREVAGILESGWPGAEPVASRVLEIALGVARAAGIAL